MPPPEGGARVDLATLGRLGQTLPFDQGSRLIEPAILLVQAGHRSAGERIESLAAFDAAIARQGASVQDRRRTQGGIWRLGNLSTPNSVQKLQTALHANCNAHRRGLPAKAKHVKLNKRTPV